MNHTISATDCITRNSLQASGADELLLHASCTASWAGLFASIPSPNSHRSRSTQQAVSKQPTATEPELAVQQSAAFAALFGDSSASQSFTLQAGSQQAQPVQPSAVSLCDSATSFSFGVARTSAVASAESNAAHAARKKIPSKAESTMQLQPDLSLTLKQWQQDSSMTNQDASATRAVAVGYQRWQAGGMAVQSFPTVPSIASQCIPTSTGFSQSHGPNHLLNARIQATGPSKNRPAAFEAPQHHTAAAVLPNKRARKHIRLDAAPGNGVALIMCSHIARLDSICMLLNTSRHASFTLGCGMFPSCAVAGLLLWLTCMLCRGCWQAAS